MKINAFLDVQKTNPNKANALSSQPLTVIKVVL